MNSTDRLLKSLPHVRSLFGDDEVQKINTKYNIFENSVVSKDKRVQRLSITNAYDYSLDNTEGGYRISNLYYHQLMYNSTSDDKKRRLDDYRSMANYSEVERALTEICNEFFEKDDKGRTIKMKLEGNHNSEVESLIEDEFYKFLEIYKFDEKGAKYIRDWLVEGELFFENIVSLKKPELGIIGTTRIGADRCDPLYYDLDNELIDCFLLRAKSPDSYPFQWGKFTAQASYGAGNHHQLIFLNEKQVTYIGNDQWSDGKKYKLPVLSFANRPYRQLSLIEDATVIYMLVRAPERLVFNVDVGNMQPSKAEQYMKRLMSQFWSKKTIDTSGRIENVYDPQGMLENYWFPVREGGQGSKVESIGGGKQSPDNLEILNFFVQKLYQSLKVPLSRLNSETAFGDGENITREELCFAEYIINLQKLWASSIKKAFIVHLKLKGKKILDAAKKLGVSSIQDKSNKVPNNFQVSQIFKDDFNNKCWDLYDVLSEEINTIISKRRTLLENEAEYISDNLQQINTILEKIDDGLIVESENINKQNLLLEKRSLLQEEEKNKHELYELEDTESDITSWWEQYDLKEEEIHIKFVEPSQFFALREQQLFKLKYDNFSNMSQNDFVSKTLALKMYLGWSDKEILANLDMLRKDAAFRWEIGQIEQNGPDFREKALEELQNTMDAGGDLGGAELAGMSGGGGPLPSPSGGGGDSPPSAEKGGAPDFGTPPEGSPVSDAETNSQESPSEPPKPQA